MSTRIDRVGPTLRPNGRASGYQKWRSLLFMHWPVPISELRPLVPPAMELDLFEGEAYVGLVPFSMESVRPAWAPSVLGFNFLETNVRTYVVYEGRPGVFFFSLDAASRLAVKVAQMFWGLPYHLAKMSFGIDSKVYDYQTVRVGTKQSLQVRYAVGEKIDKVLPQSLEFFFLERYLLFLEHKKRVFTGQVHHRPYPVQMANIIELRDELLSSAGFQSCQEFPVFTHYSPGVDVEIFPLQTKGRG